MRPALGQGRRLARTLAVVAACGTVGACVTGSSGGAGGPVALFRAPAGEPSEAVAPGLNSGWYIERRPIQFAQVGLAGWADRGVRPGLAAWIGHLLRRDRSRAPEPTGVVAMTSALPVPSVVEVTDLRTYRTISVRVDERAHLHGSLILLGPEAAEALGVDRTTPLQVRIRYSAPVFAFDERPTLRYALLGPDRQASAPILTASREAPPPVVRIATPAPLPIPALGPVKVADTGAIWARLRPALDAEPPRAEPARLFHIQAGAFARLANARHAAVRLAPAGEASIVPLRRGDLTLFGVWLKAGRTPEAAEQVRAQVARIGFRDAEVIRPL